MYFVFLLYFKKIKKVINNDKLHLKKKMSIF
jgi:hypothetical protein